MDNADWHFPRAEFAERTYKGLAYGPVPAVSIFTPRGMGKTRFLTHDLAPLAEANGHRVVYVDFEQAPDSQLATLISGFDRGLWDESILGHLDSMTGDIPMKPKIRTSDGPVKLEIDQFKIRDELPINLVSLIGDYCELLQDGHKRPFLLFDEFQELKRTRIGEQIIAALRAEIDIRKPDLAVVFAGSSKEGLNQIFTDYSEPFYLFAFPETLPPMKEDFVDHQIKAFQDSFKVKIAREKALRIFHRLEGNLSLFHRSLLNLQVHPGMPASDAMNFAQADLEREASLKWCELNPSQRIMARMLATKVDHIYGKKGNEFIMDLTGRKPPSKSVLQSAAMGLSKLSIVDPWKERWSKKRMVGNSFFENWISNRPASEF